MPTDEDGFGNAHQARGYPQLDELQQTQADVPVEPFISTTVEICYEKLFAESSCCLDSKIEEGVTKTVISRPETTWMCNKSRDWDCRQGCCDGWFGGEGVRGKDLVWTAAGATCESPRILYIHGGSWEYCSPTTCGYDSLASKLASLSQAVVMVIDYPLVPVGHYWSMTAASHSALQWLRTHGPRGEQCSATAPLFIGGDSSGGGTALSLILWNLGHAPGRHRNPAVTPHIQVAGAFFYSPWTNLMCDTPTYYFNTFAERRKAKKGNPAGQSYIGDIVFRDLPFDNARLYRQTAVEYLKDQKDFLTDKVASPFYAEEEYIGGPPMYFAVSGTEVISGDSMASASKAAQQGVKVYLEIYPGMWHVFPMYSEGCGSGKALWQGVLVLNRTASFIQQEAAAASARSGPIVACRTESPQTYTHYGPPLAAYHPWIPVQPLQHACHVVDWTGQTEMQAHFGGAAVTAAFLGGFILGAIVLVVLLQLMRTGLDYRILRSSSTREINPTVADQD